MDQRRLLHALGAHTRRHRRPQPRCERFVESLGLAPADIVVVESNSSTIENIDTLKAAAPGAASLGLNVFDHTFDEVANHPAIQRRQVGVAAWQKSASAAPWCPSAAVGICRIG